MPSRTAFRSLSRPAAKVRSPSTTPAALLTWLAEHGALLSKYEEDGSGDEMTGSGRILGSSMRQTHIAGEKDAIDRCC